MEELSGVERWMDLGLLLGLPLSTIVEIKCRHWNDGDNAPLSTIVEINAARLRDINAACLRDMLNGVDKIGGITLSSLTAALRDRLINRDDLASQLEQRFSSKDSTSTEDGDGEGRRREGEFPAVATLMSE